MDSRMLASDRDQTATGMPANPRSAPQQKIFERGRKLLLFQPGGGSTGNGIGNHGGGNVFVRNQR